MEKKAKDRVVLWGIVGVDGTIHSSGKSKQEDTDSFSTEAKVFCVLACISLKKTTYSDSVNNKQL